MGRLNVANKHLDLIEDPQDPKDYYMCPKGSHARRQKFRAGKRKLAKEDFKIANDNMGA